MNFLKSVLFLLFPPTCGICGKINSYYLCEKCEKQINAFICPTIQLYPKNSDKYFKEHIFLFLYQGIIRNKIIEYKFEEKAFLYKMFSEFFVKNEKVLRILKKYDIIISVPMTKAKKANRGYNQSELIAKELATKIPILEYQNNILVKIKDNQKQSSLNKKGRCENVKNVYKIQNESIIQNKKVIIFDDIYTTGSTANECARMLMLAGAKDIGILTIAKDEINTEVERNKKWKI